MIESLKDKLKSEFPDFKKLYLFGSRAKGHFDPESDYDIVVIFEDNNREKRLKVYNIIGDLQYTFNVFIDINILTEKEFSYNPFFLRKLQSMD